MFDAFDDPFREEIDHGSFKNLYLEDYGRMKEQADRARLESVAFQALGLSDDADKEKQKAEAFEGCAEGILSVAATLPMADA
jgi:hypothetical protein|tara:strand:- start:698 stop:943 length:246 start_codon:yes stop_codon:yes gene_type:complete